jgi:hypothetical protein
MGYFFEAIKKPAGAGFLIELSNAKSSGSFTRPTGFSL